MPEPTTYREPARPLRATPLERPACAPRHASLLGSLAALAGAGALAATQLELLAIVGAGVMAAGAHALCERRERRRAEALAAFLGSDEIALGPGTWTSPDGCRRVRSVTRDSLLRFEHLDPSSDETLASFRVAAPVGPDSAALEVLERRVAPLLGRARDARCFAGLPPELGGEAITLTGTSHVILERYRDGVLLVRCDADGTCMGDTLHGDVASALRQLEAEHGEHVGGFREVRSLDALARPRSHDSWDGGPTSRLAL